MKKYNFNAGPSKLPREVIEATAAQCLDFNGSGLSLMEISHRAKDFQPVMDEAVALFKELLNIPEGYSVIFLGGGASLEFCMIPYNFLEKKAAYLNTGVWAKKAMKEANHVYSHIRRRLVRVLAIDAFKESIEHREYLDIAIVIDCHFSVSVKMEWVNHIDIIEVGSSCLISDVDRMLEREIPYREGLKLGISGTHSALVFIV